MTKGIAFFILIIGAVGAFGILTEYITSRSDDSAQKGAGDFGSMLIRLLIALAVAGGAAFTLLGD